MKTSTPTPIPSRNALACGIFLLTTMTASTAMASSSAKLQVQGQCQSLKSQLIDQAVNQVLNEKYPVYYYGRHYYRRGMALESSAPVKSGARATGAPGSYTKTNVQEQGVDEADKVKTDGKFIYSIHGNEVVVLKSWPMSETNVVARYKLPKNVRPGQLLLKGDRLAVLSHGSISQPSAKRRVGRRYVHQSGIHVHVLDISNRAMPKLVQSHKMEGYMRQARMIGSQIYMVSGTHIQVPASLLKVARAHTKGMPSGLSIGQRYFNRPVDYKIIQSKRKVARSVLLAHMKQVGVTAAQLQDAMPKASNAKGALASMYRCQQLHVPAHGTQMGVLNVSSINIDVPGTMNHSGIFGNGWQIYASTESLYVAMPQYGYNYWSPWNTKRSITKANTSVIHKFSLKGQNNRPQYAASGVVQGHLLNQFSMSEYQGHLRVATTDQRWWSRRNRTPGAKAPANANNIQVLRESGQSLKVVGEVKGLAPNERIYSARMVGDKAYVVTFRQTDPLFVIDLKNPEKPEVKGELKINGFSSYIHPLGPNHLLTIGQDADKNGRVLGAHLQIFDVTNPKKPIRTHHKRMTNTRSWSSAQHDHHAFTYDPVTKTLAVPLSHYNSTTRQSFNGLAVYQISKKSGIEEIGKVDHVDMAAAKQEAFCAKKANANNYYCRHQYSSRYGHRYTWQARLTRSIIIDGHLFSSSQLGWKVHNLKSLKKPLATVSL